MTPPGNLDLDDVEALEVDLEDDPLPRRLAKTASAGGGALPARGLALPHGKPRFRDPKPPGRLEDLVGRDVEVRLLGPSSPLRGELVAVGRTDIVVERHGCKLAMIARSGIVAVLDEGVRMRREP